MSTFTLMDHWFQMEMMATAEDPMLEGYTTLAFLAGQTRRMRLGLLVTGVTYRHPGLLAKTVTTLDVLSGGRVTASMVAYAELGVELVELMPIGDPVAYTTEVVARIVPALDKIQP